ncbi:MAG TPA: alanine racemase [Pseudorhizobium sp.]|nr:alanine racemase [Pseudorhizobium sp.]
MAHLNINLPQIRANIHSIVSACTPRGIDVIGIVKPCQNFDPIVQLYATTSLSGLGVSKASAAKRWAGRTAKPIMLTCVPRPDLADDVVRYCDLSLNSELGTIAHLAEAARHSGRRHSVILMVEVGDLREGMLPHDVLPAVAEILALETSGIHFAGIGANYGCVNGVLPNAQNVGLLEELAEQVKRTFGAAPEVVSLGGSVVLDWLDTHGLPSCVNQIRVGEPLLLGTLSGGHGAYRGLHTDALEFEAIMVEVKSKPSYPAGQKSGDAFGVRHEIEDRGTRRRAILDFGVVDTDPRSLITRTPRLSIITSNSDYTVVDITDCEGAFAVGDSFTFGLTYKSMLQCFTSTQLQKNLHGCREAGQICPGCAGLLSQCSQQMDMDFIHPRAGHTPLHHQADEAGAQP